MAVLAHPDDPARKVGGTAPAQPSRAARLRRRHPVAFFLVRRLAAGNVKRVVRGQTAGESLWEIEPMLEMKTVWHPIGQ